MTEKTRESVRSWLAERSAIVDRYAGEIGATYDPCDDLWTVHLDGTTEYVQSLFKGKEKKALGLLVNHSYLRGAQDALYGFGIMRE